MGPWGEWRDHQVESVRHRWSIDPCADAKEIVARQGDAESGRTRGVATSARTKWCGSRLELAYRYPIDAGMKVRDRANQRKQILAHQLGCVQTVARDVNIDEINQREEQHLPSGYRAFVARDNSAAGSSDEEKHRAAAGLIHTTPRARLIEQRVVGIIHRLGEHVLPPHCRPFCIGHSCQGLGDVRRYDETLCSAGRWCHSQRQDDYEYPHDAWPIVRVAVHDMLLPSSCKMHTRILQYEVHNCPHEARLRHCCDT